MVVNRDVRMDHLIYSLSNFQIGESEDSMAKNPVQAELDSQAVQISDQHSYGSDPFDIPESSNNEQDIPPLSPSMSQSPMSNILA